MIKKITKRKTGKIHTVLLAFLFAIVIFALVDIPLFSGWYGSSGLVLDEGWEAEFKGDTKTVDIPYQNIVEVDGILTMSKEIYLENPDDLGLMMPHVSGTAYEIYLNGEYIGGIGRIGDSTANIWNSVFNYSLRNAKKGLNHLEIRIFGFYDIGFRVSPYITDYSKTVEYVRLGKFMREDMLIYAAGISLAFGIVLLISYLRGKKKEKVLLYAAALGFMVFMVAVDCVFTIGYKNVMAMLFIKKVRFLLLFGMTNFLTLILYEARNKPIKRFTLLTYLITLLSFMPILFSATFYQWYTTMWLAFVGQGLLVAIMIWLVFTSKTYIVSSITIVFVVIFTFSQGIMSQIFGVNVPNSLQYSVIVLALITGATYITRIKQLFDQTAYLEDVSVRDPLTGMFNRHIIKEIAVMPNDCMVVLDIDNFKNVNDRYGHDAGDNLLRDLCLHLNGVIRETDYVIRLGGDEFCIVFKSCPIIMADKRMMSLREIFSEKYDHLSIDISYGITMVDKTFDETLKNADALMYTMKERNKNLRTT